jgi:subtilase family serine protease
VTAVGGTVLTLQAGSYVGESGWERSGGGPSNLFREPNWQIGTGVPQNGFRNIPDIALDASCDTPYAYYWNGGSDWFCGTSGGAPTFAGITADIEQAAGGRLGWLNPVLYSLGSSDPSVYHDITSGCSLVKGGSRTKAGYCAHPGWNFVTGWGSIDASKLAKHFAPNANIMTYTTSYALQTQTNLVSESTSVTSIPTSNRTSAGTGTGTSTIITPTRALSTNTQIAIAGVIVIILALAFFRIKSKKTKGTTRRPPRLRLGEPGRP